MDKKEEASVGETKNYLRHWIPSRDRTLKVTIDGPFVEEQTPDSSGIITLDGFAKSIRAASAVNVKTLAPI